MSSEAGLASVATEPEPDQASDGAAIGGWTLGPRLRRTLIADVYRAQRGEVLATLHLVHPELARLRPVVAALQARAPEVAQLTDHRNVAPTFGGGFEDGHLYVVTEPEDGPVLRDVLDRKHAASGVGLPPRGAGNVIALVAQGLASTHGLVHGALGDESVTVSRGGRIAVADLALGPALCAAIAAGAVRPPGWIAPEVQRGEEPTAASDVYGLGALLYDALVGQPLARGGPRPSEAAPGIPPEVDEIIARACAEKPERRFGSVTALRELVMDVLCRGVEEEEEQVGADGPPVATPPRAALVIPPALEAAMEDPAERWLVTKGRFDFGPFSMKGLVEQIQTGHVHHGNVLFDKDEGGRVAVEAHPLLGPLVEAARQARDDARRAQAEVKHQSRERKRGVTLYGFIGAGVLAAGVAVYLVITALSAAKNKDVAGVDTLAQASLNVTVSAPKPPEKKARAGGGRRGGGGGRSGPGLPGGNDALSLDLSDDSDEGSETLDMGTVFSVYSRYGNRLGGCLHKTGTSSASISIIIDGPSGRVSWMRVNGESKGALHGCLSGVMRAMKFPSINGPRTRAEFDIGI
ncbi:MAG: protein kinase [Kofleriaceae bacterium]|nr:protein kinase [Kofleriaceae bacterium]MCL4224040.1 protein kinase [Myxococcales bacterium]